jgi:hypothetical protein
MVALSGGTTGIRWQLPLSNVRKGDGTGNSGNNQWKNTVASSGGISWWLQLRVVEEVRLQVRCFNTWQRRELHELQLQLP